MHSSFASHDTKNKDHLLHIHIHMLVHSMPSFSFSFSLKISTFHTFPLSLSEAHYHIPQPPPIHTPTLTPLPPHTYCSPTSKIKTCSKEKRERSSHDIQTSPTVYHMTYHVTSIGFDGTSNLSLIQLPRLAWNGDQTLVPNLELNAGGHAAISLLNCCIMNV